MVPGYYADQRLMELCCLFALILISLFNEAEAQGTCKAPTFPLPGGTSNGLFPGNQQVIVPTMTFSGCGVIRDWAVVASGGGPNGNTDRTIELQLFHPDSARSTVFTKVTSSVVTTGVTHNLATHTFSGIDFTFSPGDVLGFYYPSTGAHLQVHFTNTFRPNSVLRSFNPPSTNPLTLPVMAEPLVPLMSVSVSCMECPASVSVPLSSEQIFTMFNPSSSIAVSSGGPPATPTNSEDVSSDSPSVSTSIMSSLSSVPEASSSNEPPATSPQSPSSTISPSLTTGAEVPSDRVTTSSSQPPSGTTDVGVPVDNTDPPNSPGAAIGGAVVAVVLVVLVLILLSVVVAVCAVKKRRKYKLGKPPLYDLPPDAYCTFGSGHTLMPPNGQHEMTQLTLPTHYDDIVGHQTSDVTNNQSAVAYETPQTTLQRQSNEMYDDIRDPLSTSKGAPENRTVYSEMVYTNPGTDVQVDTSDHEYQDADEISLEEVKRQPPLEWDETKSEPIYGWVPTMSQRKNVSGSENTASGTENVYYSNPGYTGQPSKPPTLQRKTSIQSQYEAAPESETYWTPATKEEEIYAQMAQWGYQEIPRSKIILSKKLGEGQFGEVYKAEMRTVRGASLDVAVKLVKKGAPDEERTKFLQEAANLGQFKHRHVVRLIGVVTCDEPQMMLMELLTGGDLKEHLDSLRNSPSELSSSDLPSLLLQFCKQVVDGLACLARKSFVHRDIAARNILLDKELNCKISDFGMTRDLEDDNYYSLKQGSKIPLKWTAPETLFYKKYSIHSDIWSYGMLMYEIWSVGHKPFEDVDSSEMVRLLHNNYCLPPPPGCPRAVYEVMVKCWNYTPRDRPSAEDILGDFCRSERQLLSWRKTDGNSSSSKTLGAPLIEGRELYRDLQCTYTNA